ASHAPARATAVRRTRPVPGRVQTVMLFFFMAATPLVRLPRCASRPNLSFVEGGAGARGVAARGEAGEVLLEVGARGVRLAHPGTAGGGAVERARRRLVVGRAVGEEREVGHGLAAAADLGAQLAARREERAAAPGRSRRARVE